MLSAYYFINAYSGKVLDDPAFSTANGTQIDQYQLNGGTNQRWDLVPLADGNDLIVNAYSGKVLDDPAFSKSNGTLIDQYQRNGGTNQQWRIVTLANGNDEVFNAYSGKVLDDPAFSTANGTKVDQYQLNGGTNQQWKLLAAGSAPAVTNYVVNAYSGKVLDDPAFSTANGTHIDQYQLNGGTNQRWVFVALADGYDLIVNAYSGKVLEDPAFSTKNGTPMDQYTLNGGLNQQWNILGLANGNDNLINASNSKVLDDPAFSTANGTSIDQYQPNGGTNQQWKLVAAGNAPAVTNYVVNAYSGKVLDDPAFSTSNKTVMDQYQLNGGTNQRLGVRPAGRWQRPDRQRIQRQGAGRPGFLDGQRDPHRSVPAQRGPEPAVDRLLSVERQRRGDQRVERQVAGRRGLLEQQRRHPSINTSATTAATSSGSCWRRESASAATEYLVNAYSGLVVDDPAFSTANGTLLEQYQYNGGTNQQWTLVQLADGNDLIVNKSSGKVLDDPAFSTASTTPMDQYQLNGGANQQWKLDLLVDGNDKIVNAFSGKVLDDPAFSRANGAHIIQYQPNGGMNQEWVLFVPNTTAVTNTKWSGYVAETNFSDPQANSVSYVTGAWIVPTVTGPSSGAFHSSIWVGIDGYGNNTVEQIGTEQDVVNGTAVYSAWWEMYSTNARQTQQPIPWTIRPGDAILAYVQYISSGPHANQFLLALIDSTSHHSFIKYASSAQYQNPLAQRSTAEWIVEATSVGNKIGPVPDFGSVTFTNASATIDGVIGPINSSSWQSQAVNLIANGGTVDTTSVLTQAGSSFAVIDNLAGTAGSSGTSSGTSANGTTQIGPTVGATLRSGKETGSPVIGRLAGTGAPGLSRFRRPIGQLDPTARHAIFAEGDSSDR